MFGIGLPELLILAVLLGGVCIIYLIIKKIINKSPKKGE